MSEERCIYCNTALSRMNVLRAVDEAGLPQDCLVFACPTYDHATHECYGTPEQTARYAALWSPSSKYPDYRPEL